ncbi:hypothetical protein M0R45_035810 [Rubus argutus]|uniref:Uncharacterized protein n=1 Tax=Rubus argutus TaxID=59490 RepID=A0AAW1VW08_RUBAR
MKRSRGPVRQESTAREESSGGIMLLAVWAAAAMAATGQVRRGLDGGGIRVGSSSNGWFEEHGLVGVGSERGGLVLRIQRSGSMLAEDCDGDGCRERESGCSN